MKLLSRRWLLLAAAAALAIPAVVTTQAFAGQQDHKDSKNRPGAAKGLGPLTGLLPRDNLTLESAIQVDLSKETVRLPLYPGRAPDGTKVWFVLMDASDSGLAHDLGVNFAPKLNNLVHQLPRVRADGDHRVAVPGGESVRAGGGAFRRCAGLQPDADRDSGSERVPARRVPARRSGWPRL